MRKVGILGGMGPEATVLLMKKIIECTKAQDDQDHIPLLVDNNTQVPSRIEAIINKKGIKGINLKNYPIKNLDFPQLSLGYPKLRDL